MPRRPRGPGVVRAGGELDPRPNRERWRRPLKLLLIDGHSLAYRAFFALPDSLATREGLVTNAVYGFTAMLLRLLEEERPDALAVCFDAGRPFRLDDFAEYKAHRPGLPDKLRPQIGLIKAVVEGLGGTVVELEGYEADDCLGTLARAAEEAGAEAVIVTGDLDALQLVTDGVRAMITRRGISELTRYDAAAVREDHGVRPEQIPDLKGLVGDTSDNIPGVPGVGPKTAVELLRRFGSVEGLLEHLGEVERPKLRQALAEHADQARLSKRLATIDRRVPLELDLADLALRERDPVRLYRLFTRLEFKSLVKKLGLEEQVPPELVSEPTLFAAAEGEAAGRPPQERPAAPGAPTGPSSGARPGSGGSPAAPAAPEGGASVVFSTATDRAGLEKAVAAARAQAGPVAFRVELDGADAMRATPTAFTLAHRRDDGRVRAVDAAVGGDLDLDTALEVLRPWLADPGARIVGHDLKPAVVALERRGVRPDGVAFDTALAAYLLDPGRYGYAPQKLAKEFLGQDVPDEPPDAAAAPGVPASGREATEGGSGGSAAARAAYRATLAAVPLLLQDVLSARLEELGLTQLFREVELPLMRVLAAVERRGFKVDAAGLQALGEELGRRIEALTEEIYALAGERFNVNSTRQLAAVLFDKLGLEPVKRTKTGYSTDAEVLEQLADQHPICEKLLEHREVSKLKSTYVDGLRPLVHPDTGRIHTTFQQTVAATGRLSSVNPNLQNIPVRTELGRKIRKVFIPGEPGWVIVSADYSQIELRILAHLSRDPLLVDAFLKDQDIHQRTAAEVFGVAPDEVTPEQRNRAKAVNYGLVYGQTDYGLSRALKIPREEAAAYIASYFLRYQGVKAYIDQTIAEARDKSYVTTVLNRRRYLPDIHSRNRALRQFAERTAVNTPIQGSAADIIKLAMVRAETALSGSGLRARLILQVHDELVFEAPADELDAVAALARDAMGNAYPLDVPLKVDVKAGPSWDDTEPVVG